MLKQFRSAEVPAFIVGFLLTLAGVIMLVFTGPRGLGWLLVPLGMFVVLVVSYRSKRRADEATRR